MRSTLFDARSGPTAPNESSWITTSCACSRPASRIVVLIAFSAGASMIPATSTTSTRRATRASAPRGHNTTTTRARTSKALGVLIALHDARRGSLPTVSTPQIPRGRRDTPVEDTKLLDRRDPSFLETDAWLALKVNSEFVGGLDALARIPLAVAVFGSARIGPDDPMYEAAHQIGLGLAREGFAVITGGGPGVMEAANRGCQEAGGYSIGCTIEIERFEPTNPYLDLHVDFSYFFNRKTMFMKYSEAFVVLPGGLGTLDELFEALVLIQTNKVHHFPVVLFSTDYWAGLVGWLNDRVVAEGKLTPEEASLFTLCDDP